MKSLYTLAAVAAFVVICADYAGFVDLPQIVQVPAWLIVIANILRWAVWEGLIKPKLNRNAANG